MRRNGIFAWLALVLVASTALAACSSNKGPGTTTDSTTAPKCGAGNGQKATGEPIKLGAHRDKATRHRLHRHPEHGQGVLRLRQRQRRHQRPADPVPHRDRADRPRPGRLAGQEAGRERQGARHRRQHQHHRVRGQPQATTSSKGFYIIDSGIAPECYSTSNSAAGEHGPALQRRRRHAVPDPPGRQEDRARPVQRARHGLHRRRLPADRQGRGDPDGVAQGERADPGRELGRAEGRAGGRRRTAAWC